VNEVSHNDTMYQSHDGSSILKAVWCVTNDLYTSLFDTWWETI